MALLSVSKHTFYGFTGTETPSVHPELDSDAFRIQIDLCQESAQLSCRQFVQINEKSSPDTLQ